VLTSAPGAAGQVLYLVGEGADERGGGLWAEHRGEVGGEVPAPLDDPLPRYRAIHRAVRDGLVRAAHDPSEGGLAVALAELAIAGRKGISVDASAGGLSAEAWLFSESLGRLLLVVDPADQEALEVALAGVPCTRLGTVEATGGLRVRLDGATVVDLGEADLTLVWRP
jgi:phosphoribosylformylglycinamidine synthase